MLYIVLHSLRSWYNWIIIIFITHFLRGNILFNHIFVYKCFSCHVWLNTSCILLSFWALCSWEQVRLLIHSQYKIACNHVWTQYFFKGKVVQPFPQRTFVTQLFLPVPDNEAGLDTRNYSPSPSRNYERRWIPSKMWRFGGADHDWLWYIMSKIAQTYRNLSLYVRVQRE